MNTEEKIQDFRNKGNICFKNKNISDAIFYYKEGLQLDATNPHLNSNLAQAYLEKCDFVNAEHHAITAIANDKYSTKGYFRAAKASASLGDRTKAIKYLKQGIESCIHSDTEDLRNYLQTLCEEDPSCTRVTSPSLQEDIAGTEDVPSLTSDSDSDESMHNDKLQSLSTSRMSASTTLLDTNKTSITNQHSVSMSQTSNSSVNIKVKKKKKKKRGHVEGNPFMATLESIKKEMGVQKMTVKQFWIMQQNELQSLLKEGSEVLASGLSRKAVEKYKIALGMILDHSLEDFRLKEIDLIVLKYSLCIGWIDLADYGDIIKAVEYLKDIEDNCASKFPAVFYGLGSAYFKLNRYKIATEHLEKGLLFLKREVKFEVHPWPGTNNIIPETTRNGLEDVLKELLKMCRAYHEPDAICRYSQCLTLSSHIIPSEHIFYSDPDFCGFVTVICEEKCRIEYHLGCWKDYKEAVMFSEIGKLSDKDFIGRCCPTTDCVTQGNQRSVIVKIEIVGDDTTVKASIEAPKTETAIKESKKMKKRKNEKSAEIAVQDKPKSKPRPKIKKTLPETIQTTPQEMHATSSMEELPDRLQKLKCLRDDNFGYTDDNHWNPKENYYGREDIERLDHFLSPEFTEETEAVRGRKEFVFSYFYEFIRKEGPQTIKEVEQQWQNEFGDFERINDFMNSHTDIRSFLLQSYRFASIADYICLAEQLADTYNRVKMELVDSLSSTLTGHANCTVSVTDMSQLKNYNEVMIESQTHDTPNLDTTVSDPELKWILTGNLSTHNLDIKSSVETLLGSFVGKPVSINGDKAFIPHAEVDDLVEDPDISTAEDIIMSSNKVHVTPVSKSFISEGEKVVSVISDSSCSDSDMDIRSDEVDDDGEQQGENQKTQEEENGKVKEEKENEEAEEKLDKLLNPDASEFKPQSEVLPEQEELNSHPEDVEPEVAAVSVPYKEIQLSGTTSRNNALGTFLPLQSAFSEPDKWSLNDDQSKVSTVHLGSECPQKMAVPPVIVHPHPGPCTQMFALPVLPPQQLSGLCDSSTQTDEMGNFEEEINTLENTVKKLKTELEVEKNEKETLKKTSESKLEEQDKKIKELELEMAKAAEEKNKAIKILKEELTKKEEECEAEKIKFGRENKNKEILENSMKATLRNLISETGQKVKELEEELSSAKCDMLQYQQLVLKAKKEAGELQISIMKQKCLDTLETMKCKLKYLSGLSSPNKTEVTAAIQNWEQYHAKLTEHEIQFRVLCASLGEKSGNINLVDFVKLEWPDLPKEPSCPLGLLEEMTQKALDEREDVEGKLIAQDKAMVELKVEQQNAPDGLTLVGEQKLKLTKVKENKNENIQNTSINKELAPQLSKTLEKLDEVAKKLDPSNLKGEGKCELFVGSDQKGLKQNRPSNVCFSAPAVNPLTGVSLFQHSGSNYGYQPLLHSSPYFYNHPQMTFPLAIQMQYTQQQGPPVTSLSSVFQPCLPQAPIGNDKASAQKQVEPKPEPSSSLTEIPEVLISTTGMTDKSQPPSESKAVPEKKKSSSTTSGLTPIEITKTVSTPSMSAKSSSTTSGLTPIEITKTLSTPSTSATATGQGKAAPCIVKGFPIPTSIVGEPKQKLTQMSKPAETPKPLLQMPLIIAAASSVDPKPLPTTAAAAAKLKLGNSFQKLMAQLRKSYPTKTDDELVSSIATVRERNNNSLSGIKLPKIIDMVDKVLKEKTSKKQGSMGLDKFGGNAWSGVRDSASNWEKPSLSSEDDCIICMESMGEDQTSLNCKHSFHTKCIRHWLRTESVCPICRSFTRMVDEFPPLS